MKVEVDMPDWIMKEKLEDSDSIRRRVLMSIVDDLAMGIREDILDFVHNEDVCLDRRLDTIVEINAVVMDIISNATKDEGEDNEEDEEPEEATKIKLVKKDKDNK